MTGRRLTEREASHLASGPGEEALVVSGLDETMTSAYHQVREIRGRLGPGVDLRTAAYVDAIDKIAVSYESLGIWP
jgi:glutamate dehydrogenase (NAD(P)+)